MTKKTTRTSAFDTPFWDFSIGTTVGALLSCGGFGVIVAMFLSPMAFSNGWFAETPFIVVVGFGWCGGCGVWIVLWFAYNSHGRATACPACQEWFSALEINSWQDQLGRTQMSVNRRRAVRDAKTGATIAYVDDVEQVPAVNVVNHSTWHCKHCKHKWHTKNHQVVQV
jgi:hypothetical protein